jgi:Transcriptional regulator PadR-like family
MDPTLELEVMGDLAGGLKKLSGDADATRRVLQWAASAFLPDGMPMTTTSVSAPTGTAASVPSAVEQPTGRSFSSLPDLYSTVSPASDSARALVVGYWFQVMQGEQDLDGFQINKELKHLGHGVTNITTALSSLIERKPQLVIQTRKSGNSKQARKRYRLTDAGVKAVERMLSGGEI